MRAMSEHYIVLEETEVGPSVRRLLDSYRRRQVECPSPGRYVVYCTSALDLQNTFRVLELARDLDFPPEPNTPGDKP